MGDVFDDSGMVIGFDAGDNPFDFSGDVSSNALSLSELANPASASNPSQVGWAGSTPSSLFNWGNAAKSSKGDGVYSNTQPVLRLPNLSFGLGQQGQANTGSNVLLIGLLAVAVVVVVLIAKK